MQSILVPQSVANQITKEEESRRAEREKAIRDGRMRGFIARAKDRLKDIPPGEQRTKALCQLFLNTRSHIVLYEDPTWEEVGQFVSDVLLGEGVEYERLT